MEQEKDLSEYASFDVEDIVAETKSNKNKHGEATAYLDRTFLINMINEHHRQSKECRLDFYVTKRIDISEYNFTGADLKGISNKNFELFNFHNCDISSVSLDRVGIDFFHHYIQNNKVIHDRLNLSQTYLGPIFVQKPKLGIECNLYLNLSNLNLSGSNFSNSDIKGLILENANISYCNFKNAKNLDPKQFAFSLGFEKAIFSSNELENQEIKNQIKNFSKTLDPTTYYSAVTQKPPSKILAYLASLTNFLDD
jgi:hypothetical protein